MNTLMNIMQIIALCLIGLFVVSFGIGLMFGGLSTGAKTVAYELKTLAAMTLWTLKVTFRSIAKLFNYLARCCEVAPKKKLV